MITGERNTHVNVHVTPQVKYAAKKTAVQRGISLSAFISEAIEEKLTREGIDFSEKKDPKIEPPLPFEEVTGVNS